MWSEPRGLVCVGGNDGSLKSFEDVPCFDGLILFWFVFV